MAVRKVKVRKVEIEICSIGRVLGWPVVQQLWVGGEVQGYML